MPEDYPTTSAPMAQSGLFAVLRDLGRYVVYYPSLAAITGSVNSAILLSYFIGWAGKQVDPAGWIYKTAHDVWRETGLSADEQATARKILRRAKILDEKYAGLPRKLHYRIDSAQLEAAWTDHVTKTQQNQHNTVFPETIIRKNPKLVSGKTASNNAAIPGTTTSSTTSSTSSSPPANLDDDVSDLIAAGLRALIGQYPADDLRIALELARPHNPQNVGGYVRRLLDSGAVAVERDRRDADAARKAMERAEHEAERIRQQAREAIEAEAAAAWSTLSTEERAVWIHRATDGPGVALVSRERIAQSMYITQYITTNHTKEVSHGSAV